MPLLWYAVVAVSPAGHPGAGLLAGVAVAVGAVLAVRLAARLVDHRPAATSAILISATARHASGHRRPIRQLDPDAPGRPRPRAPGRTGF
jgi:predicted anti-sigma-YlaC factor YlaD